MEKITQRDISILVKVKKFSYDLVKFNDKNVYEFPDERLIEDKM